MMLTDVVDTEGKVVQTIDLDENCNPYAGGDYHGHCGGCGSCMGAQATYAGYTLKDHIDELRQMGLVTGTDTYLERLGIE